MCIRLISLVLKLSFVAGVSLQTMSLSSVGTSSINFTTKSISVGTCKYKYIGTYLRIINLGGWQRYPISERNCSRFTSGILTQGENLWTEALSHIPKN